MPTETSEWTRLDPTSDRLVLRDGSVAIVRPSTVADRPSVQRFFHELAPESRYRRFLAPGEPSSALVAQLCDSSTPSRNLTLIALRDHQGELRPIAIASYAATSPAQAEVAFAVADGLHGRGLGTALLERLANIARSHGVERFEATTLVENMEMLEVFRASGFEMQSKTSRGVVEVRLNLQLSADGIAAMDERDRLATVASLRPVLQPRAIAVIGVSRDTSNLGRRIFDGILANGFTGPVYPVNRRAKEIAGRLCYGSIRDVPMGVELAVIATPRHDVLPVVVDCAAAGITSVVVVTAGFAEVGEDGRALQRAVLDAARAHGMRLVGPNCMGVLNASSDVRLNASFADRLPPAGRIAIASQSGGVGLALLELASVRQLGISTFVSLGNKADVSGNDLLQWSESDPQTSVLLLYLESFGNPRRFAQLARRISRKKPIVVVKAGRTASGSRAAGSHTAGLASNEAAVDALFRQSGVIRADTIDEMFDVAQCLDLQPLPAGSRVGIITNAGGPGILAADACEASGLIVQPFSATTREALGRELSTNASIGNPVDLVASAGAAAYEHAVTTVLASADVDSLMVIYTPIERGQTNDILAGIGRAVGEGRAAGGYGKPVVLCILSGAAPAVPLVAKAERIPTYVFPENAARALGHSTAYANWRRTPAARFKSFDSIHPREARKLCQLVVASRGDTWLTSEELTRVLDAFGLPLAAGANARSEQQAAEIAALVGYPVVLKVQSTAVLHKTDVSGVRLDLADEPAVRGAFRDLAERFPDVVKPGAEASVQVQPMLTGVEMLVGVTDDPTFGPLIGFGLGGVAAEVIRDVAFRIAPLSDRDVEELLSSVRSYRLLQGYRGHPRADIEALREVLCRVSLMAQHIPELRELDLNPVIVLPNGQGCRIVDARVRVSGRSTDAPVGR